MTLTNVLVADKSIIIIKSLIKIFKMYDLNGPYLLASRNENRIEIEVK
jgi:hypothetical protein